VHDESLLDVIQWPETSLSVGRNMGDGLGFCFAVAFWRLTQQDVRLRSSEKATVLTARMIVTTGPTMTGTLPNLQSFASCYFRKAQQNECAPILCRTIVFVLQNAMKGFIWPIINIF
jgi:hypothetical protein